MPQFAQVIALASVGSPSDGGMCLASKHPHPVGKLPDYGRPDQQIRRPKTELIRLFQRDLGETEDTWTAITGCFSREPFRTRAEFVVQPPSADSPKRPRKRISRESDPRLKRHH